MVLLPAVVAVFVLVAAAVLLVPFRLLVLLLVLSSVAVVCIEPGEHAYVGVRHAAAAAASSVCWGSWPGT